MEGAIVFEGNHQHRNSTIVSKSMESSIKIGSISIDLINANEKDAAEKCEHFSIRGFVSQIRKKDWKMCSPFISDEKNDKSEEQSFLLPPLEVPKFRFWRCQNCLQEFGSKSRANEYGPVMKFCSNGFTSSNNCSHAPILADTSIVLSTFQQPRKVDILKETKVDANPPADGDRTSKDHPSRIEKREKKNGVDKGPILGPVMILEDNLNQENHRLTSVSSDINSRLMEKAHQADDTSFKLKCHGSTDPCKPDGSCREIADTDFAGNLDQDGTNADNIHAAAKEATSVDNPYKELVECGIGTEANNVKESVSADRVDTVGLHSKELDSCDYASSESAEMAMKNNLQDVHHDNPGGLHRKKIRKVRLLTELLCENGDGDTNNIRTEDSPSNAVPDASTAVDKFPGPQTQVATPGNARRCLGHSRKRKLMQDDDWRPLEASSPKPSKAVRILKKDAELTTEPSDAILGSESQEDALARMSSQNAMKNHYAKRKIERNPIIVKKKDNKSPTCGECLSLEPSQENVSTETKNKDGDAPKGKASDEVLLKSGINGFNGKEIDFFPLPAPRVEGKPTFSSKKSKTPKVHDLQASLLPWNHGMVSEMARKDVEITHSGPLVPFCSVQDASSERGLNLSLNSYIGTQGYDRNHIPEVEDRRNLQTRQEGTSGVGQFQWNAADSRYDRNFSFTSKSFADGPFGKFIQTDTSYKRPHYRMAFLNERQNYTSQFEVGGCSHMQQKDLCGTSSNEKTLGNQEHPAVKRRESDPSGVDKMCEQGTSDDIPMEIVELMAKNQYERCLADAEKEKYRVETYNNSVSAQTMDFTRVYGHKELNLFHQEATQKQKSRHKNERNGIIKRAEDAGSTKQKLVDHSSQADRSKFSSNQLDQAHFPAGFGPFIHSQDKPSCGVQHPASSSSRQMNCKWIGDLAGKRFSPTSLQASGPCNTCQSIPQQSKEPNHLWASIMPSHIPFVFSMPQKRAALPTNIDMLANFPGGMHKENMNGDHVPKFTNENVSYMGKQNRNYGSETLNRTCAEYPFACQHNGVELNQKASGSLDLYSNETIPAMHLLSLMDAGLRSNASASLNLDATPKFLKRPASHDHDPKDFARPDSVAYKATNTIKHPLYDYRGKNHATENSHERIPLTPNIPVIATPVDASAPITSFQLDKSFKKTIDFSIQVPQDKEKKIESDSRTLNKGCRSQNHLSASGNFGTNCGSVPAHSMQNMYFGPPDSMVLPMQFHSMENPAKRKLEASHASGTVVPYKSSIKTEVCSLNRNPSDFSIPEAGNVYMIAGEDLRFGKLVPLSNGRGTVKPSGPKRQRKLPAMKEHGQHLVS